MTLTISPYTLEFIFEKCLGNIDDFITVSHVCKDWRMIASRSAILFVDGCENEAFSQAQRTRSGMSINFPDIMYAGSRYIATVAQLSGSVKLKNGFIKSLRELEYNQLNIRNIMEIWHCMQTGMLIPLYGRHTAFQNCSDMSEKILERVCELATSDDEFIIMRLLHSCIYYGMVSQVKMLLDMQKHSCMRFNARAERVYVRQNNNGSIIESILEEDHRKYYS